ncbi:MAG: hypothetical protein ACRCYS_02105 [Beijerinckiaceae bacterium]
MTTPNTTLADAVRDLIASAYETGATDVHNAWINDLGQGEADFGEAASDYAASLTDQITALRSCAAPMDGEVCVTNGQYADDDFGLVGDAARSIAYFCEGDMRRLVYVTAKEVIATLIEQLAAQIASLTAREDGLPPVGSEVIWSAEGLSFPGTVEAHAEGWVAVRMIDGSLGISRPSRLVLTKGSDDAQG